MTSLLMFCALAVGQAPAASPAPLSEQQVTRLRELVRTTQATASELRGKLAQRERELAELYTHFELDVAAAEKLQEEIVDLQRQLVTNYHKLQVELRSIVGPERFAALKLRIDYSLRSQSKPSSERQPPARPKAQNAEPAR